MPGSLFAQEIPMMGPTKDVMEHERAQVLEVESNAEMGNENSKWKILWQRTIGDASWDKFFDQSLATDGSWYLTGSTRRREGMRYDAWLVRLDALGNMLWERLHGKYPSEEAYSLTMVGESGVAVVASTYRRGADAWLIKWDRAGFMEGAIHYGGENWDRAYRIISTPDRGYLLAGATEADQFEGPKQGWLERISELGHSQWTLHLGGTGEDKFHAISQQTNGTITLAGFLSKAGSYQKDLWLAQVNAEGQLNWERQLHKPGSEQAWSLAQFQDGHFLVAGSHQPEGTGNRQGWLVLADKTGQVVTTWSPSAGRQSQLMDVAIGSDGRFAAVGMTEREDQLGFQAWLVWGSRSAGVEGEEHFGASGWDEWHAVDFGPDGTLYVSGFSNSFGAGEYDGWLLKLQFR